MAQKEEQQKKKVLNKLIEGAVEKDKMEEKLKMYKLRYADKLYQASTRIKSQVCMYKLRYADKLYQASTQETKCRNYEVNVT